MESKVKITGSTKGGYIIVVDDENTHNYLAVTEDELSEIVSQALLKFEISGVYSFPEDYVEFSKLFNFHRNKKTK